MVSSSMIDRVAGLLGRQLAEVPVGFKWFVRGLFDGSLCFGGEESAGASFLRRDGTVWVTEKDGIIMDLLAVELMALPATGGSRSKRRIGVQIVVVIPEAVENLAFLFVRENVVGFLNFLDNVLVDDDRAGERPAQPRSRRRARRAPTAWRRRRFRRRR